MIEEQNNNKIQDQSGNISKLLLAVVIFCFSLLIQVFVRAPII